MTNDDLLTKQHLFYAAVKSVIDSWFKLSAKTVVMGSIEFFKDDKYLCSVGIDLGLNTVEQFEVSLVEQICDAIKRGFE